MTYKDYDLEIYPNYFSAGFEDQKTGEYHYFEISPRRNDILEFQQYVAMHGAQSFYHIGFNNLGFDSVIVHDLMNCDPYTSNPLAIAYAKCDAIINKNSRFNPYMIWDSDQTVQQIDLYKLNHYDNNNKRCSLKQLEFAMRMESIQDLPIAPGTILTYEEMDIVKSYMRHDIRATRKFAEANEWAINLRHSLSETYGVNMLNMSEAGIGSKIIQLRLNEAGIETHYYETDPVTGKRDRKPYITRRSEIHFGEIINDNVRFESAPFIALHNWMKRKTITETKEALDNIPYDAELFAHVPPQIIKILNLRKEDFPNAKIVKNRKTRLSTLIDAGYNVDLSKYEGVTCDRLSVVSGAFQFDLGTGGIHGSIESRVLISDDEFVIKDFDFASWYPHLAFKWGKYPEHLGPQFCTIYESMFNDRQAIPKSNPVNYALKIALNGSYGNMISEYSFLYDPKCAMGITMNGQLYICMLAEQMLKVPQLEIIQVNTDGITIRMPRRYSAHVDKLITWIEAVTRVKMEAVTYSRMCIQNVNNYIAQYAVFEYWYNHMWVVDKWFAENNVSTKGLTGRERIGDFSGKCKRKNAYMLDSDKAWHQDRSMPIVAMAANAALLYGEDIRAFIENHIDIFDFMIMLKVPKSSWLRIDDKDIQLTSRVYASTHRDAGQVWEWRKAEVRKPNAHYKGVNMKLANNIKDADFADIDYDFYVAEAEKLVLPLIR